MFKSAPSENASGKTMILLPGKNSIRKATQENIEKSFRVNVERPGASPGISGHNQPPTQGTANFVEHLKNAVSDVNDLQKTADKAAEALASGKTKNIAETMMAMEKADIAMKTMLAVRGKLLEAYREVMKMQV